jgi:hypothetical protein
MNKATNRKELPRATIEKVGAFSPEELAAIREVTQGMKKGFPWLYAEPEQARIVAARASFPRSIARARQDDPLLRLIYCAREQARDQCQDTRLKITESVVDYLAGGFEQEELTVSKEDEELFSSIPGCNEARELSYLTRELCRLLYLGERFQPKTDAEFFSRIVNDLGYLDNYVPIPGDFAVEELQKDFIGLMQRNYAWGNKGLPTKGEVIAMAKARLEEHGKKSDFAKSYWSELLQTACFGDWLPNGPAGRPLRKPA